MPEAPTAPAAPTPTAPVSAATPPTTPAPAETGHESFPRIRNTPIPDKIMDAFRKRARPPGTEMSNKPVEQTKSEPPPETKPKEDEPKPDRDEPNPTDTETTPPKSETTEDSPQESGKGKKVSPWKLVDQYKAKVADLEKQLAGSKTGEPPKPGEPPKEFTERLTKAESRVKELEDEIRFTNYQKSPEFQDKYQKPYEAAWAKAVKELNEIEVTIEREDGSTTSRPATAEDMLALVNLPLGAALRLAKQTFGDFASAAMTHREKIKDAFDTQQEALKDAKVKSEQWEKTRHETMAKALGEIDKSVGEVWAKANQDAATDAKYGTYFTPRENDPEWNQRLAKGFELVDKAFSDSNPRDPRLNPEQRKSIVERHAAVRNRAAAFGPLRYENEVLHKRVSELEKELSQYKSSEAPQGGGSKTHSKNGAAPADPWARVREGLSKYAR